MPLSGPELTWWDSVAAARLIEQFTVHTPTTRVKALRLGDLAVRVKDEYEGWARLEGAAAASRDLARGHVLLGFFAARAVSNLDPGGPSLKTFLAAFEAGFSTWVGNNWQLWSERPVNILGRGRGRKLGTRWLVKNSERFMYAWMEPAMPACAPQGYGGTLAQQALESRIARTLEMWSHEAGHETGSNEVRALLARSCAVFRAACELASGADLQDLFAMAVDSLIDRIERSEPITTIGRPVDPATGYVPFLPAERMADVAAHRRRTPAGRPASPPGPGPRLVIKAQAQDRSGEVAAADSVDLGPESAGATAVAALDRVIAALGVDKFHVRQGGRAVWWPDRLPLTIDAVERDEEVRVQARTPLVREVSRSDAEIYSIVDSVNRHATLSALAYDDVERVLYLSTTGYLDSETLGTTQLQLFVFASALAYGEALGRSEGLAALVSASPATSEHPILGHRRAPHRSLGLLDDVRSQGAGPSRFDESTLRQIGKSDLVPWESVDLSHDAIVGRFSCGGHMTSTTILSASGHPAFGRGALVLTQIAIDRGDVSALVVAANRAETSDFTGVPQFGAWTTDPEGGPTLVHVAFVPNYAAPVTPLPLIAAFEWLRCDWVAEQLL